MTNCPRCKRVEPHRHAKNQTALCADCMKELEEQRYTLQDAALAECERIEDLRQAYWD